MDAASSLSLRRYGPDTAAHRHDHAQLVLPLRGTMALDIGGRGLCVGAARGAFIAPGEAHACSAQACDRFAVIDCSLADLGEGTVERLRRAPNLAVPAPALHLLGYLAALGAADAALPDDVAGHCLPLLLAGLTGADAPRTRLDALARRVEAALDEPWPVERMARVVGVGPARLHALFRRQLDTTPQAWLTGLRLREAMTRLAGSDQPIARIAHDGGWSDQSALTRAMRRVAGCTPASYRRRHRG